MLKRKQKIFFLPALGGVVNAVGAVTGVGSMIQASGQADAAEKQAAEANATQMNAAKIQADATAKNTAAVNELKATIASNPTGAAAVMPHATTPMPHPTTTHMSSETSIMENLSGTRTKYFAAAPQGTISKLWETAKNLHRENPKLAEQVKFGLGMGATLGVGKYVAGKVIANDAEKSGVDLQGATQQNNQQKQMYAAAQGGQKNYSVLDHRMFADPSQVVANAGEGAAKKSILGKITSGISGQAMNAGFAGLEGFQQWGAYKAEKKALQGMKSQSGAGGSVLQQRNQSLVEDQRQYSILFGIKRAGKGILNGASTMMGAGNAKVMKNAGENLAKNAGNNNIQSAVGNFMKNHKYASTAVGLGAGWTAFDAANSLGEKAIEKPMRSVDKKAYAWQDYQNSKMEE